MRKRRSDPSFRRPGVISSSRNQSIHSTCKSVAIGLDLMLPEAKNPPTLCLEKKSHLRVALTVVFELSVPKASIRFWANPVLRTAMPLAAIDKNSDPSRGKYDIGFSEHFGLYAIPQAQAPQRSTQEQLRFRIPALYLRHAVTPLTWRKDVRSFGMNSDEGAASQSLRAPARRR